MSDLLNSFIATAIIQILTVLQGVVSARCLLPQGKGELTIALLWPTLLVGLGTLGMQDAIAVAVANSQKEEITIISASALWIMIILSGLVVTAGYLVLPNILAGNGSYLISTSLTYLWYAPPTLITSCFVGILLGKLRFTQANILRVSVYLIILPSMIILYYLNKVSVKDFMIPFLIASWGALLLSVVFITGRSWIAWVPSLRKIKTLVSYGLKVHVGSLAGMLNIRLDQLLLSIFLAPSSLGFYVVAVSVGSGASLVALTIAWVALPRLAQLSLGPLKVQAWGRFMRLSLFGSLISAGILFICAPLIVTFFFGEAYNASVYLVKILVLAAIPLGGNAIFTAGFKASGLPSISSKGEILGLMVASIALFALIPSLQAQGAAWASLITHSATFIYLSNQCHGKMGVGLWTLFMPAREDWVYIRGLLAERHFSKVGMQK